MKGSIRVILKRYITSQQHTDLVHLPQAKVSVVAFKFKKGNVNEMLWRGSGFYVSQVLCPCVRSGGLEGTGF